MYRLIGSIVLALVLGTASVTIGSSAVHAAAGGNGPNALTIQADCGASGQVDVVINFQANQFAAAHVVGGGPFVPLSFGAQTVTFTAPDGHTETFTQPPITKGGSGNAPGDTVNCSFDFTATDRRSGGTIHVIGTVTGFIRGRAS